MKDAVTVGAEYVKESGEMFVVTELGISHTSRRTLILVRPVGEPEAPQEAVTPEYFEGNFTAVKAGDEAPQEEKPKEEVQVVGQDIIEEKLSQAAESDTTLVLPAIMVNPNKDAGAPKKRTRKRLSDKFANTTNEAPESE